MWNVEDEEAFQSSIRSSPVDAKPVWSNVQSNVQNPVKLRITTIEGEEEEWVELNKMYIIYTSKGERQGSCQLYRLSLSRRVGHIKHHIYISI